MPFFSFIEKLATKSQKNHHKRWFALPIPSANPPHIHSLVAYGFTVLALFKFSFSGMQQYFA
jgi:hypothetical protein